MNGATIISISLTSTNKINQTSSYFLLAKKKGIQSHVVQHFLTFRVSVSLTLCDDWICF